MPFATLGLLVAACAWAVRELALACARGEEGSPEAVSEALFDWWTGKLFWLVLAAPALAVVAVALDRGSDAFVGAVALWWWALGSRARALRSRRRRPWRGWGALSPLALVVLSLLLVERLDVTSERARSRGALAAGCASPARWRSPPAWCPG